MNIYLKIDTLVQTELTQNIETQKYLQWVSDASMREFKNPTKTIKLSVK